MGRGLTWGFTFGGPDGINARIRRGELDQLTLKFSKGDATLTIPSPSPPPRRFSCYREWDEWIVEVFMKSGDQVQTEEENER